MKMTEIQIAKENLKGHSICLCKDGAYFTDDGRGISPMLRFIGEGRDLVGCSAADIIVGKAAAMLFVKAGIREVYGEVTSQAGYDYLTAHDIPCTYGTLTQKIINRAGDGVCPMEQTVAQIDDPQAGYLALTKRLSELRKGANNG